MKNSFFLPFLLMGTITLSTPSCSNVNWEKVKTTSHTLVSNVGIPLLTAGAVEALVYKSIKANPESSSSFSDVAEILTNVSYESVLTTEDLRNILKTQLDDLGSKYRTYALLSMDVVFGLMKNDENGGKWDVSEYRTVIDAIVTGISEAQDLYTAQKD